MKIVDFVLIAFFVSATTAASSHRLQEFEEFFFEYDSESEDSPHRTIDVRKTNFVALPLLFTRCNLPLFQRSLHTANVGSKTELGRSETYVWSQLDKVVQMLAKHLSSHASDTRNKQVQAVSTSMSQDEKFF